MLFCGSCTKQRTMAFLLSEKCKKCVSTNKRETRSPSQSVGIVSSVHSPTHNTVGANFLQSEKKQAKKITEIGEKVFFATFCARHILATGKVVMAVLLFVTGSRKMFLYLACTIRHVLQAVFDGIVLIPFYSVKRSMKSSLLLFNL